MPIPAVSLRTAHTGKSAKANELGMREMQERAYEKRGEQYLLRAARLLLAEQR